MNAEILSVGTELLLGQIVDTDAPRMAQILAECGVGCTRRITVGDNWDRLVGALKESLERADIVITIGGLGPTSDDLTRDAIAQALNDPMVRVPEMEQELRDLFQSRGYTWVESNAKQADRPASAAFIPNPNGTAPGLHCQKNGKIVLALPGPPNEFNPMADGAVRTILEALGGGVIHSRTLRIIGMGESLVEERVRDLMDGDSPSVAPYAKINEVHLRVTARAETRAAAERIIAPMVQELQSRLGTHIYALDDMPIEEALLQMLRAEGTTVAVAESMTGGDLASRLSAIPGSSHVFRGGVVAYSIVAKEAILGVPAKTLLEFGPVSEETATAMATGARDRLGATYALSITGNAGPDVDSDGKPVGRVYIGLAHPEGVEVRTHDLRGNRATVRSRTTQIALNLLRDHLMAQAND